MIKRGIEYFEWLQTQQQQIAYRLIGILCIKDFNGPIAL